MLKRLKIGTKIGFGFAMSVALLTTIGLISYQSTNKLIETSRREKHTYQVLSQLEELSSQVTNAETGQRGYIITGEQRYLEPLQAAIQVLQPKVKELRRLTADNPNQQRQLDILELLINKKLAELQQTIELRQNQGFEAAQKLIRTGEGKELMAEIRKAIQAMQIEEDTLLKQRSRKAQAALNKPSLALLTAFPYYLSS